jgi:hypothetical protein
MARNHLNMKKIREIMRLKWACGCSHRAIAQSIGVSEVQLVIAHNELNSLD